MPDRTYVPSLFFVIAILIASLSVRAADAPAKWDPVPPVDFTRIKLEDFRDDELDLPYYLGEFADLANSVVETGEDCGFINAHAWRNGKDNKPYNARVMESHLTLAWFYTQDRPWNPYYNSPAIRQRLEAMLTRLCDMQNDDGRFSEYGPRQWNLPATAFATKFLGETITLLQSSQAKIDPQLMKRTIEADRKAILATLKIEDLYKHGKSYTNQYANVFAGAAAYLALFPDPEIKSLLDKRFADARKDFLSPCGYFYEANGPDFGYTLGTHASDDHVAWFYLKGTPIGDAIVEDDKKWNDWLGYNLLRQPDGSTFVANRGVETRQQHPAFDRQDSNLSEAVENARAFATSQAEQQANLAAARKRLAEQWGKEMTRATGLKAGGNSGFSPYVFLERRMPNFYPPAADRDQAIAKLPYLARDRFTHQRVDSREPTAVFTYIRRPNYYAIFNSGKPITKQQRLGLGLIWLPKSGTVFQTQTNTSDHCWGTHAAAATEPYEATDGVQQPTFAIADKSIDPQPGSNRDLPDGVVAVTYPLGKDGKKTIRFNDDSIEIHIEHPGAFVEQIPLLISSDPAEIQNDSATIGKVTIQFPAGTKAAWTKSDRTLFGQSRVQTLNLSASDSLTYTLRLPAP